jgi:hypothetical protein
MIFVCHACKAIIEPDEAEVTILKKYLLNPTFIPELEIFMQQDPRKTDPSQHPTTQYPAPPPTKPDAQPQPKTPPLEPVHSKQPTKPFPSIQTPKNANDAIVSTDESRLLEELHTLERALKEGTITEAEYDRRFVKLRLQLRQLRNQPTL